MNFAFGTRNAALVIRSSAVELLVMRGSHVISQARIPVEGPERDHLVQAIRQAFAVASLKTDRVAVAIPTRDVLIRFFTMPLLPKTEWEAAIQFEARKYLPFKTDTLVWDYTASEVKSSNSLEVIFAAIQRAPFQELQALLADAGVKATCMEPRSQSLARLSAVHKKGSADAQANEYVCIVDIDPAAAHLVIARNGLPYLARDVEFGRHAEPSEAQGGSAPVDPEAQRLFSELRVSLDFFTREHPTATISNVFLVGDEHVVGSWHQWLASQLGRPVEVGRALLDARSQGTLSLSFAAAIGLLRRSADRSSGAGLDLLKRAAAKPAAPVQQPTSSFSVAGVLQSFKSTRSLAVAGAAAALLFILAFVGSQQISSARRQLAQLIQSRPKVGWGLETVEADRLKPLQEEGTAQVGRLKSLVDRRVGVVAKLDALVRSLSDGMWLTGLSFEERPDPNTGKGQVTLRISGACYLEQPAKELSAIQDFEAKVRGNPALFDGFDTARVEQIREQSKDVDRTSYTYRTFQLNCASNRRS